MELLCLVKILTEVSPTRRKWDAKGKYLLSSHEHVALLSLPSSPAHCPPLLEAQFVAKVSMNLHWLVLWLWKTPMRADRIWHQDNL